MKNKIIRFAAIAITALMFIGTLATIRAAPPPAPAIWITPETLNFDTDTTSAGDKFNVTVWISTLDVSYAWQVDVKFNTSQLQAVRAAYTGVGKSLFVGSAATVPVSAVIDNTNGDVVSGESLVGMTSIPAGSDSLFWIEFQIALEPTGTPLTSQITINPDASQTFILTPTLDVMAGVSFGFATYTFTPPQPRRDVAVINLALSNSNPTEGDNVTITIDVLNNGTMSETFSVEVYLDTTLIDQKPVTDLIAGDTTTLTFEWNTTGNQGPHTIKGLATGMVFDVDPSNDFLTKPITVRPPGGFNTDITGPDGVPDGKVDMYDVAAVGKAFGSSEAFPRGRWNPSADVNGDGEVNIVDVFFVVKDFWKK